MPGPLDADAELEFPFPFPFEFVHWALKWVSEPQIEHFITVPSFPIGFFLRPKPFPEEALPWPLKYISAMKAAGGFRLPFLPLPRPFPLTLRFTKRRALRVGFPLKRRHLTLARS